MSKTEYIRPEFGLLDIDGLEYHLWMDDVKIAFVAKECTHTITPSTEKDSSPTTEKQKAEALRYLKAHIDPNLLWGYQHIMCLKELWDALASRFGSIEDFLLPRLNEQWNDIRFLDYVKVGDFQRDMLKLQAHLNFCGIKLTDKDMIQKTLSTFPLSFVILANQ
ncbi:uncharacterized protein LOC113337542 [Papaver somniferum]|uniref:uncharacterized protein LOC113337542 n=1 Tax=Papaver somniferum TaxID=3469 RepID=UPI000E6F6F95|nr:uncharacterized protein LOC113337542 [Papaver somniferum]